MYTMYIMYMFLNQQENTFVINYYIDCTVYAVTVWIGRLVSHHFSYFLKHQIVPIAI